MKLSLADFVRNSIAGGRHIFELRSPSGEVLFVGASPENLAEELQAIAQQDAATLSGAKLVYVVWAKSEDGRSSARYPIELSGGREATTDVPEAHTIQTPQAVIGHLTRLVIEQGKSLQNLARDVAQARSQEVHDSRIIVQRYARMLQRRGDEALALKLLEIEEQKAQGKNAALGELVKGAVPLAMGIAARTGLLPAAPTGVAPGAANGVDALFASFSDAQSEQLFGILGPARAARVLRARGPHAAAELAILLTQTTEEERVALLGLLTPAQGQILTGILQGVEQQVDAKAKANGVPEAKS